MSNLIEGKGKSIEWYTPLPFFKKLHEEFVFTLDVCARPGSQKVERYFSPEQDGLKQEWAGVCWMNPPYGSSRKACKSGCTNKTCETRGHATAYEPGIEDWLKKAYESSQGGGDRRGAHPCQDVRRVVPRLGRRQGRRDPLRERPHPVYQRSDGPARDKPEVPITDRRVQKGEIR